MQSWNNLSFACNRTTAERIITREIIAVKRYIGAKLCPDWYPPRKSITRPRRNGGIRAEK
jgi:hypothetical protein